ncbi:hypothetical protein AB833_28815 [Chromatiales bacterium (ex Bugula neritina AB1)]|nr:hypothetical protein AB833_28815 [Chromatiales bacterium (ex Bugula neritina AB1)]
MCRLAAYIGAPCALEKVITLPPHSLIEQSQATTEAKLSVNGDGFGFAWYSDRVEPGLYREVMPAWTDGNLLSLARTISSGLFLAHVRASTFGHVSRTNCHPFTHGRWSFMHNGQISNFAAVRRPLESLLSDELFALRNGNTDSELLFLLLLQLGLKRDPIGATRKLPDVIDSVCRSIKRNRYRMTCVMSDGVKLYAWRLSSDNHSPTLYIKQASGKEENTGVNTILASEPIDEDSSEWLAVEENCLVTVYNGLINCKTVH